MKAKSVGGTRRHSGQDQKQQKHTPRPAPPFLNAEISRVGEL